MKKFKLLFATVFSIPLIVWFVLLGSAISKQITINNGTLTTATVTEINCEYLENNQPKYSVLFEFTDKDGNIHTGKTDAHYSEYKAKEILNSGVIKIKYDKNYNAVRADYKFEFDILLVILPVFGLVGVGFWISFFIDVSNKRKDKATAIYGVEKYANLIATESGVIVNGTPYYRIKFVYKDAKGTEKTFTTRSIYNESEARFFETVRKFKIKTYKGHVAITQKIDYDCIDPFMTPKVRMKKCAFCGNMVEESVEKCPGCGARKFEDM